MKKLFCLSVFILLFCINLDINAQKEALIKKQTYDVKNYLYSSTDPNDPFTAGFCSFLIPGLGQMTCGASEKGIPFLLASASGWIPTISGLKLLLFTTSTNPEPDWNKIDKIANRRIVLGLSISAVFWIWSIIDAPRTAKIQNMKYREKNITMENIRILPYINRTSSYTKSGCEVGLTINLNF